MRFPGLAANLVALRRKTRQRLSYAMPSVGVPITTRASHSAGKTATRATASVERGGSLSYSWHNT